MLLAMEGGKEDITSEDNATVTAKNTHLSRMLKKLEP